MSKTFVSLVGLDIADYVRKTETKTVRKNVSIPSYLNELAKKRNLNFCFPEWFVDRFLNKRMKEQDR